MSPLGLETGNRHILSSDLQSSSVSWWALAFSGHMVTGGSILALAFLLASVTIGAHSTLGLTAPASVSRSADTGSRDGVTQCSVLALTSVTAVGTPMITVTSWGEDEGKESRFSLSCLTCIMVQVTGCHLSFLICCQEWACDFKKKKFILIFSSFTMSVYHYYHQMRKTLCKDLLRTDRLYTRVFSLLITAFHQRSHAQPALWGPFIPNLMTCNVISLCQSVDTRCRVRMSHIVVCSVIIKVITGSVITLFQEVIHEASVWSQSSSRTTILH